MIEALLVFLSFGWLCKTVTTPILPRKLEWSERDADHIVNGGYGFHVEWDDGDEYAVVNGGYGRPIKVSEITNV